MLYSKPGPKSMRLYQKFVELGYVDNADVIQTYLREHGHGGGVVVVVVWPWVVVVGEGGMVWRGGGGGRYAKLYVLLVLCFCHCFPVFYIFRLFCIYFSGLFTFVYIFSGLIDCFYFLIVNIVFNCKMLNVR